jgi:ABC-type sugar transport system ATPase subunit
LLRCIAGLEDYDGEVFYGEQNMRDVPPKDRGIGIVFQNYALYPNYVGKGNLSFFFRMHKRENEINARIQLTAEIMGFGFDALLDRKPSTLSGGQKQRLAVARAICRDPKLLLFDEPLSNLDAKLRTSTRIEIRRLISRFGITTLYVTHDQVEATLIGDRIAVMDQGRVLQAGEYHAVYDHPANTFVAGFLGQPPMNLFDGVVADNGVRALGGWLAVGDDVRARLTSGQAIVVGLRPEHLHPNPPHVQPWLRAQLEWVERLPSERAQLCYCELNGQRLVMRVPSEPIFEVGDRVGLHVDPTHVHLFDAISGNRL